jgi:Leucine-rich repeat (LRR) protein
MKALAHDPSQRYARVKDLQADLAAYQTGFVTSAEKGGIVKQLTLLLKRHKALASSTAAALLLLAGISAAFTIKVIGERNRAEQALANLRDSAPLYAAKASALIEKQQFDEALVNISAAIAYRRGEANYHFLKGNILQSLFRFPESRQAYSAVLALDANHVYAREDLQLCDEIIYADAGRMTPSIRTATKLNALMRRQGRTAEAVALLSILNKDRKILFDTWTEVFAKAGLKGLSEFEFRLDEDGFFTVILRNRGIENISFLRGMPLKTLHLLDNRVSDISPLAGAPLRTLFIGGNPIADISPLRGMKLETFNSQGTNIKDLTPLAGMPVQHIGIGGLSSLALLRQFPLTSADLSGGSYTDLSPLRGMALTTLRIANSRVGDLSPLRGMPLEELTMESTRVSDLRPLAGQRIERANLGHIPATDFTVLSSWPLRELALQDTTFSDLRILAGKQLTKLDLGGTAVTDIAPLRGMPLKELYLAGTKVTELRPLTDIATLERLTVPAKANNIELLRQLPKLEYLDTQRGTEKALKSAREFWKEYDAKNKP